MTINVGDRIPSANFKHLGAEGPADIGSTELFASQKVAVFGLPGAYTPVCSKLHLPGFVENSGALRAAGIDKIACVSINDPFVMDAWGKEHGTEDKILMLSDSDGQFTRALGLEVDLSDFGLGERSQRYSMLVDDGVVRQINVEDTVLECGVSSAASMLSNS